MTTQGKYEGRRNYVKIGMTKRRGEWVPGLVKIDQIDTLPRRLAKEKHDGLDRPLLTHVYHRVLSTLGHTPHFSPQ